MTKFYLNLEICKGERLSNWENRPLRKSQTHYAALDAYVLVKLMEAVIEEAAKKKEFEENTICQNYDLNALA